MLGDFPKALPRILVYEGGCCNDAHDPGGRTNKGVTQATYNMYRRSKGLPAGDVFDIAANEVSDLYTVHYWNVVHGDELPAGLDLAVFDAAVNSGPGQAGKWLQRALGAHYLGIKDGLIGGKTLDAVNAFCVDTDATEDLIAGFCSRRLATLRSLSTWKYFGKGWAARIANCQKIGLAWAAQDKAPYPIDVSDTGGNRKALIADIAPSPVSEIATHTTTAVAGGGALAAQAAQQLQPLVDTFGWLKYACGGLMLAGVLAGIAVKVVSSIREAAADGASTAHVDLDADAGYVGVTVIDELTKVA